MREMADSDSFNASAASLRAASRVSISFCSASMRSRSAACCRSASDWRPARSETAQAAGGATATAAHTSKPAATRMNQSFFALPCAATAAIAASISAASPR
ncbi:Uncharacterised protein [Bordetella pertussis]|nr:Uncharacterised protein [Bordetella pertussis]CFO34595.1 Uncharacterised protein [Bordetella pertussis]CFP04773.1 Uncharacterised protein [Bordetella pertussis]CFP47983.1 Uncharacterised protein [Bordetella pertussis]CFU03225.1 Uncharacterised protein [Bordetella pertussis]